MVSPDVVVVGSEYFAVYLSHVYMYSAGYAKLTVLLYLLRCLVYHMLSKTRRCSRNLYRVIGEVLVLGLLVVVYKIPYSSQLYVSQARCNWCVLIILLSISYNVWACHLSGTTCVLVLVQYTAVYPVQRVCLS